jgi:hypothetical protein
MAAKESTNKTPTMFPIVVQKWEESEAGWGTRPDGWTMHLNMEAHAAYMKQFTEDQRADYARTGVVPDEYTKSSGDPYPMDVDEATYEKIKASPKKMIWGEGNMPPKGKQGTGGWVST